MTICYFVAMRHPILPLLLLVTLGACAQTVEATVAGRLTEAGLSRPMAECMAGRWVERLNVAQLRKMSEVAADLQRERGQGRLTVGRFIERVRAVEDAEIISVVSSSAAVCALAG